MPKRVHVLSPNLAATLETSAESAVSSSTGVTGQGHPGKTKRYESLQLALKILRTSNKYHQNPIQIMRSIECLPSVIMRKWHHGPQEEAFGEYWGQESSALSQNDLSLKTDVQFQCVLQGPRSLFFYQTTIRWPPSCTVDCSCCCFSLRVSILPKPSWRGIMKGRGRGLPPKPIQAIG